MEQELLSSEYMKKKNNNTRKNWEKPYEVIEMTGKDHKFVWRNFNREMRKIKDNSLETKRFQFNSPEFRMINE